MGKLAFKDINDWTPSSISIVDEPDHPLCKFEVYEDDDEFIKKSINVESEIMMQENKPVESNDPVVSAPVSFFERLLGGVVTKSAEPVTAPPAQNPAKGDDKSAAEKIMEKLDSMDKKIDNIDGRVSKLEGNEGDNDDGSTGDPTPGAVSKNVDGDDGNNNDGPEGKPEGDPKPADPKPKPDDDVLDTSTVVAKSQELDPDNSTISTSQDSFMKRAGRNDNGMTW